MLTVDKYSEIRRARRDGMGIREIARRMGHATKTVRKALSNAEPAEYSSALPRVAPVFGAFAAIVDAIVSADASAPRKQRHTGMQIYRRLVAEHGYVGGYDQVRRYLRRQRLDRRETFIPLAHPPGHRAEADFGHIHVDFPNGRRLVPVLIVTWSYSNAPFALALPTERTEAILHGLVEAFAFFGCVPHELWWDNPTTVAVTVLRGRQRSLQPRYAALASHYTFTPKFCMPAKATEKPKVEHRVFDLQRRWATPVPQVIDLAALNAHLRQCCAATLAEISGAHSDTVGTRFAQDRAAALSLPNHPFDPCILQTGQVDKYQTVRFDQNSYSVPRPFAFRSVTVKGYVDAIEVVADGAVVARHPRCYDKGQRVLDPLHFLTVLGRKPAALDHAPVYRDWKLPASFADLRRDLESVHGAAGTRQFIRVLQQLNRHSIERLEQAIAACRARQQLDATAIIARLDVLADIETTQPTLPNHGATAPTLAAITVPPPDLQRFNALLTFPSHGDPDVDANQPIAEDQPQTIETADHAVRV